MTSNAQIQKLMASVTSVFWQHSNVEFKQTKLELTEIPECLKTKSSPIDKARDVFSLWPPIISASTVRYRKTSWYATGEKKKKKKNHGTPQEKYHGMSENITVHHRKRSRYGTGKTSFHCYSNSQIFIFSI